MRHANLVVVDMANDISLVSVVVVVVVFVPMIELVPVAVKTK